MLKNNLFMPLNYKIKSVRRKKTAILAIFAESISQMSHENSLTDNNPAPGLHCPARCESALHKGCAFSLGTCGRFASFTPQRHRLRD